VGILVQEPRRDFLAFANLVELLSSRPGVRRERCTALSAKGILRDAKRESRVTTQALMRRTRSSGMGKIIAVATGQDKNPWPFGPRWAEICLCISGEHE
jgi:hypothetical protein